jgi:acyl-coenzyme A thioesterase PaaI-like protein
MAAEPASLGRALLGRWRQLRRLPAGARLFSALLGRMVPYTGTISPRVEVLEPGRARVEMRDRRRVRNHLRSVHAVALMNLAEVTSGLALITRLPDDARSILKGLSIEYLKKARGTLVGESNVPPIESSERREYEVEAVIRDAGGEEVARARALWLVGPVDSASGQSR